MKYTIEDGRIHVWSNDEAVHLMIIARRSPTSDATLAQVRCEPMPMFEVKPEQAKEITGDWTWTGSAADASRIVDMTAAALLTRLAPEKAASKRASAWRARVLNSLFGPLDAEKAERQKG